MHCPALLCLMGARVQDTTSDSGGRDLSPPKGRVFGVPSSTQHATPRPSTAEEPAYLDDGRGVQRSVLVAGRRQAASPDAWWGPRARPTTVDVAVACMRCAAHGGDAVDSTAADITRTGGEQVASGRSRLPAAAGASAATRPRESAPQAVESAIRRAIAAIGGYRGPTPVPQSPARSPSPASSTKNFPPS